MSSVVTLYGMKELQEDRTSTLQVNWINPKQNIGIEIEVEVEGDTSIYQDTLQSWVTKPDGSLRRGTEFVLSHPMRGDALSCAIEEFFDRNRVHKSPTSGTHIHVDMRDKDSTLDVVKTMASIVSCIEPAIFGMFAPGREWCGYTNPLSTMPEDGTFVVFTDTAGANEFKLTFSPNTREYKYYGFNMLPLGRYGSVEFRYFNTAETAEELIEWVQFCMAVKQASVTINTRSNLKYYLSSEVCWEEFLSRFFSQWRDRMLPLLPYKEVYMRWKQTRSRASTVMAGKKKKVKVVNDAADNKFLTTRFKKFFAMKVKTESGKSKLVYDLPGMLEYLPVRVFLRSDPIINSGRNFDRREGDFLVTDDMLYRFSETSGRWLEILYYSLDPDRVTDMFRGMTTQQRQKLFRAIHVRVTTAHPYQDGDVAVNDVTSNSMRSWNDRLRRLSAIVSQYYSDEEQAAQSVSDDTILQSAPQQYRRGF